MELKTTQVANSLERLLPEDVVPKLNLKDGDTLRIIEEQKGCRFSPSTPVKADLLKQAQALMHKRHNLLRKLAE